MDNDHLAAALLDSSPDGLLLVDADGSITVANPKMASLFNCTVEDLVGSSVDDLLPTNYRRGHADRRAEFGKHDGERQMGSGLRLYAQRSDGSSFPVEISLSLVRIDGAPQTIATVRDVTDREETVAQMAMLRDRERIARDLHDMVIQRLFAAGMSLQAVQHAAKPSMVAERITATINELDNTIHELRTAIFQLGQNDERRGLSSQITELVHDRVRHLGFEPWVHLPSDLDNLPDFIADQLVATITEGLSNVVRHAEAAEMTIRVELDANGLELVIDDDGKGLPDEPKRSGGLSNMMWRAAELGGSCTVGPNEPKGTRLQWSVPV
ncbi:MAG: PAS domain S-box protein [Ilumatobacteraceae bacterium]|nr:PAS domain S-box protein [Ilumatobacteraceae bacterium]